MGRFFKLATSDNKLFVISLYSNEIKNELLGDYTGDFEMIFDIVVAEHKQATAIRYKNFEHYGSYNINIVMK